MVAVFGISVRANCKDYLNLIVDTSYGIHRFGQNLCAIIQRHCLLAENTLRHTVAVADNHTQLPVPVHHICAKRNEQEDGDPIILTLSEGSHA